MHLSTGDFLKQIDDFGERLAAGERVPEFDRLLQERDIPLTPYRPLAPLPELDFAAVAQWLQAETGLPAHRIRLDSLGMTRTERIAAGIRRSHGDEGRVPSPARDNPRFKQGRARRSVKRGLRSKGGQAIVV